MENNLESDFCVADAASVAHATFGHYMLTLSIILNHIKFSSIAVNHGTFVQNYGN